MGERSFERIGSHKIVPVDVQTLEATNEDLDLEIQKGTLREDSYFRVNVIHIPS